MGNFIFKIQLIQSFVHESVPVTISHDFTVIHHDRYCSEWTQEHFYSKPSAAIRGVDWALKHTNVFIWKCLLPRQRLLLY